MTNPLIDVWKEYGVRLEKTDSSDDKPVYFISVPSISEFFDDMGNELSGVLLAKRVKRDLGSGIQLRYRVRQERWTQARAANADFQPPKKEPPKQSGEDILRDWFGSIFGNGFGGNYGR